MPYAVAAAAIGAYGTMQGSKTEGSSTGVSVRKNTSELTMMDQLSKAQLDKFTGGLSSQVENMQGFDPETAKAQAQGVVKNIFDTYQKTALPQIANMANRGGSYDSTSQQLMANDAFARATAEASDVVLKTVQEQQKLKMEEDINMQNMLLNALQLQANVTQKQKSKSREVSSGMSTGGQSTNWASALVSGIGTGMQTYSAMNSGS